MEQHEKERLEQIRQQAEDIEIPENLRPEVIEWKLNERKNRKKERYTYLFWRQPAVWRFWELQYSMAEQI